MDDVRGRAFVILLVVFGLLMGSVAAASTVTVGSGVTFESPSGLAVTSGEQVDIGLDNPFTASDTVRLNNTTVTASGGDLTIDNYRGTFTNLSSIATNGSTITVNPGDKPDVDISGDVTALDVADPQADDNTTDFVYSASNSGSVTLAGLPASTDIGAIDGRGDVVGSGTTTVQGELSLSLAAATDRRVRLITTSPPEVEEITAAPTGQQTGIQQKLRVNVSDDDFPNDQVNVEFYLNGNRVGNDTLTGSGQANETVTVSTGGEAEWRVVATDSFGLVDKSDAEATQSGIQSFEFTIPAALEIRNASDPDSLVTGANASVTFFGSETIATRSDTDGDGRIGFSGLPLDERFEAQINADGYSERVVVIPSLFEQESAYLLPDRVNTVKPRFVIESAVASFPESNSEIIVDRPINRSGTTQYATITSAAPGLNGLDVTLEEGQRYRITVRSPGGETRQIGSYEATATERVTLQIESGAFDASQSVEGVNFDASWLEPSEGGPAIAASVRSSNLRSSQIKIRYASNGTLLADRPFSGNASISFPAKNETQYNVTMIGTTTNGETVSVTRQVSSGQIPTGGAIDSKWQELIAMAVLLVVAGLFTRANAGIGAIATASVGGIFWFVGWFSGVATGLTVAVALMIGVLAYAKQQRGGVPT